MPTATPTTSFTPEELAAARLAEILPWFENPADDYDAVGLELLTDIWLRGADTGDTVARLPWLSDGVGITESLALRALRRIPIREVNMTTRVASLPWLTDEVTSDEQEALEALSRIAGIDFETAQSIADLAWFQDNITSTEKQALKGLRVIFRADPVLAKRIVDVPRFTDDITFFESISLHALGEVARLNPELASHWGENALRGSGDLGFHVLLSIFDFVSLESDTLDRLMRQPWFADGLDDEETAFLTVLGPTVTNHTQEYDDLLENRFTQASTVSLPLAGEVNIWVFQSTPFPPDDEVLETIEDTVRITERFMTLPFPTTDIILLLGEDGSHLGSFMTLTRFEDGVVLFVPHETAHYYFGLLMKGPAWFSEGGAEFIEALVWDRKGVLSLDDRRSQLGGAFSSCFGTLMVTNLWELDHFDGRTLGCDYSMGEYFLLKIHETIGEEAMGAAMREMSVTLGESDSEALASGLRTDDGRAEAIYRAFLNHAPADTREELRELYRTLHGGPFLEE